MKSEFWVYEAKYFGLAIKQFSVYLRRLRDRIQDHSTIGALNNILDFHSEVAKDLGKFNLNYGDPNRLFEGEPHDIHLNLDDKKVAHLTQLVARMLEDWKSSLERVKANEFQTERNIEERYHLEHLIRPLEALFNDSGTIFYKYRDLGSLIFPGEIDQPKLKTGGKINIALKAIGLQLPDMRAGMWAALKSDQPDAGRQAAHSARELIDQVLKEGVPGLDTRKERARSLIIKYRGIDVSEDDLAIIAASCELVEAEHRKLTKLSHTRSPVDIAEARGSVEAAERILTLLFGTD